jgi:tRNA dimethylallyltransferase
MPSSPALPPAIFLMGPTAAGKTDLAAELFARFPVELVSVDSALVYRGMDIGTAKPDAVLLARAPHHLIDIRDPHEPYSAAMFCADATALMAEISARGRVPLLVGGTMLYFKALRDGLADLPAADPAIRAAIDAAAAEHGWPALHAELAQHDPVTAARLAPHDAQRIGRALEIWRLTGVPLSAHAAQQTRPAFPYRLLQIAWLPSERSVLHQRIAARFDAMLEAGFLDEIRALQSRYPLNADLPSMRAVGYRQAWAHLAGEIDAATFREQGVAATRQLAKRQITWLRSWDDAAVIDALAGSATSDAATVVSQHLGVR